jgi:hypothetical protein
VAINGSLEVPAAEKQMFRDIAIKPRLSVLLFVVVLIIVSIAAICSQGGNVMQWPMDQSFVTRVDLRIFKSPSGWVFQYPRFNWSGGITPSLIIGFYKLIIDPAVETLNWHAKSVATILFLVSSYLLTTALVRNVLIQFLVLALIATSALQFAEPSSDIIAAALFAFFLASLRFNWPRVISAGFLVMFGVSKIQLLLCSLGVGGVWYVWDFRTNGKKWQVPVYMMVWLGIFFAPSFRLYGMDVFNTPKSYRTFATSYILMFSRHQLAPLPSEAMSGLGKNYLETMKFVFPGATSVFSTMLSYPGKYLDFFAVSLRRSLGILLQTMGFVLVPFFVALVRRLYPAYARLSLYLLAVAAPLALIPPLMLRFISPRYLAMFYIPIVVLSGSAAAQKQAPKSFKMIFYLCSVAALILNFFLFQDRLVQAPFMPQG